MKQSLDSKINDKTQGMNQRTKRLANALVFQKLPNIDKKWKT